MAFIRKYFALAVWGLSLGLSGLASGAEPMGAVPDFVQKFLGESGLQQKTGFSTGFESVSDFSGHYIVPQNHNRSASHDLSPEQRAEGKFSHKAWIYKRNERIRNVNTNHRAYPTVQMNKTRMGIVKTAVLVELSVWVDINLHPAEEKSWFSLATFTSYSDKEWYRSYLINVDKDYKIHLMHVPNHGESRPDILAYAPIALPRRQWAKITAFIDYTTNNRFNSPIIAVWQDGMLVSASRFSDRVVPENVPRELYPPCLKEWDGKDIATVESLCGLKYEGGFAQMHFGLYAPPLLTDGVIYNDALSVSEVIRPTGKTSDVRSKKLSP